MNDRIIVIVEYSSGMIEAYMPTTAEEYRELLEDISETPNDIEDISIHQLREFRKTQHGGRR